MVRPDRSGSDNGVRVVEYDYTFEGVIRNILASRWARWGLHSFPAFCPPIQRTRVTTSHPIAGRSGHPDFWDSRTTTKNSLGVCQYMDRLVLILIYKRSFYLHTPRGVCLLGQTVVPFGGQITQILSSLSPLRDCRFASKGLNVSTP